MAVAFKYFNVIILFRFFSRFEREHTKNQSVNNRVLVMITVNMAYDCSCFPYDDDVVVVVVTVFDLKFLHLSFAIHSELEAYLN